MTDEIHNGNKLDDEDLKSGKSDLNKHAENAASQRADVNNNQCKSPSSNSSLPSSSSLSLADNLQNLLKQLQQQNQASSSSTIESDEYETNIQQWLLENVYMQQKQLTKSNHQQESPNKTNAMASTSSPSSASSSLISNNWNNWIGNVNNNNNNNNTSISQQQENVLYSTTQLLKTNNIASLASALVRTGLANTKFMDDTSASLNNQLMELVKRDPSQFETILKLKNIFQMEEANNGTSPNIKFLDDLQQQLNQIVPAVIVAASNGSNYAPNSINNFGPRCLLTNNNLHHEPKQQLNNSSHKNYNNMTMLMMKNQHGNANMTSNGCGNGSNSCCNGMGMMTSKMSQIPEQAMFNNGYMTKSCSPYSDSMNSSDLNNAISQLENIHLTDSNQQHIIASIQQKLAKMTTSQANDVLVGASPQSPSKSANLTQLNYVQSNGWSNISASSCASSTSSASSSSPSSSASSTNWQQYQPQQNLKIQNLLSSNTMQTTGSTSNSNTWSNSMHLGMDDAYNQFNSKLTTNNNQNGIYRTNNQSAQALKANNMALLAATLAQNDVKNNNRTIGNQQVSLNESMQRTGLLDSNSGDNLERINNFDSSALIELLKRDPSQLEAILKLKSLYEMENNMKFNDQMVPANLVMPQNRMNQMHSSQINRMKISSSLAAKHSQSHECPEQKFSRKVFCGGLPPDIEEDEIVTHFRRYGNLVVNWPHKAESKSYFPPKGYAFLIFNEERHVQDLVETCHMDDGKFYMVVSSPSMKDKPVQIRPWCLADSDFVMDGSQPLDPRKTIFVGGVPRPLRAIELAMIMDRLYGGVCYAGIDTDPELKYPKGAGYVAFSNKQSYIAAISARFVQMHHGEIDKRVEIKPYVLDDQACDECHGARCGGRFAPFFCANVTCLQYYCEACWTTIHSRPGREYHKPLVKEGADRPRPIQYKSKNRECLD